MDDSNVDALRAHTSNTEHHDSLHQNMTFEDLPAENILDEGERMSGGMDAKISKADACSFMISYEKADKKFVRAIYNTFKDTHKIWVDWESQDMNPDWQEQVHQGIENTDCFVCVSTAKANHDPDWLLALEHALKNGKRIIVVSPIKHVDVKLVSPKLRGLDWVMFDEDGPAFADNCQELLKYINLGDGRHAQYHTKILRRAIQWERHDFEKSLLLRKKDLTRAQHWLAASALGRSPKPTTLHLSFITASAALDSSMKKRRLIAMFFGVIVTIGIAWPSWGVFFFSLVFSHFFVYFSSHN